MTPMTIIIHIFTFIATLLLVYFAASFTTWELHPAKWPGEVRALTALCGIIFAVLALFLV